MLHGTTTSLKGTPIEPNRESFVFKIQRSSHLLEVSSDYFTKYEWADLSGKFPNLRKWLYVDKAIKVITLPTVSMPTEQPQMVQPSASGLCSTISKDTRVDRCAPI